MKVMVPVDPEKALITNSIGDGNPPAWGASTAYVKGATVAYAHGVYLSRADNSAKYPDREPDIWRFMHPETPALWQSSKTYASGDAVSYKRQRYVSIKDANTGFIPATDAEYWLCAGPINSWAAFDKTLNTKATATDKIVFELDFSHSNTVALFGLEAVSIHFSIRNAAGESVYEKTIALASHDATSWFEYFFGQKEPREEVVQTTFPFMAYSRLTITISAPNGVARVGHVAIGRCKTLGPSLYGMENGISDYSRKTTDTFGNTYLSVGNWAKSARLDLHVWNKDFDDIYRTLASLRATPTVFVGDNRDNGLDSFTIWGYSRDFRMVVDGPLASKCALEIQGLV